MINSVFIDKSDSEIIENLLRIHAPRRPLKGLDSTFNTGKIWKSFDFSKNTLRLFTMDINPEMDTDYTDDFMEMKYIRDDNFDLLVFDPPHLPGKSEGASDKYRSEYGIIEATPGREKLNVNGFFRPFLKQAKRVLKKDGIILVKLCDLVQGRRYQWQHIDFINACWEEGLIPCDMAIKTRRSLLNSSKWKNQYHLRKSHSYWIVVRLEKCQRRRENG